MARTPPQVKDSDTPATNGPPEDTTPREIPPKAQEVQRKPSPGWQSPPLPPEEIDLPCLHIGRVRASQQVHRYPLYTEWACTCGQLFVIAINKGDKRTLIKKEDLEKLSRAEPEPIVEESAEAAVNE